MKQLLLTTIAAVLVVGCGELKQQLSEADRALLKAAAEGNIEAVKQHIAAGADVSVRPDKNGGLTPLHWAAFGYHKEIGELLIAAGAEVNGKDMRGKTPLDWTDGETADLLRKHGGKTKKELKAAGK